MPNKKKKKDLYRVDGLHEEYFLSQRRSEHNRSDQRDMGEEMSFE